jgi:prepilin-type N-terminal cleavage/methylation domain-containing protein
VSRRAFSLIELVVVVVILGVIGAIAIPRMSGMVSRSKVQGAAGAVQAVRSVIEEYRATRGSPPATLGTTNFYGKSAPRNPYAPAGPTDIEVVAAGAAVTEPAVKTTTVSRAFWYNSDNGEFRARVSEQGSVSATVDLYNAVNGTSITGTADTKDVNIVGVGKGSFDLGG